MLTFELESDTIRIQFNQQPRKDFTMKNSLSFLLVLAMLSGLCACGKNASKSTEKSTSSETSATQTTDYVKLVESTPQLDLEQLWFTLDNNEAKATTEYNDKQYKVTLPVMNIKKDSFEYITEYLGSQRHVCVKLPTEELAKLVSGKRITVLGTVVLSGRYVYINDAFLTSPYETVKEFSQEEVQNAIENYGGDGGDGKIDWDEGSYPFFIENRADFEKITSDNFYETVSGEWNAKEYLTPEKERTVIFDSETSATVITNGSEHVWEYSFVSKDALSFPKDVTQYEEVRKVSDNLIVFYDDTVDYVPKFILYK